MNAEKIGEVMDDIQEVVWFHVDLSSSVPEANTLCFVAFSSLSSTLSSPIFSTPTRQLDDAREISNVLGANPLGEQYDDDELMAELMEGEQEDIDAQLLAVGKPDALSELPQVPTHTLPRKQM